MTIKATVDKTGCDLPITKENSDPGIIGFKMANKFTTRSPKCSDLVDFRPIFYKVDTNFIKV